MSVLNNEYACQLLSLVPTKPFNDADWELCAMLQEAFTNEFGTNAEARAILEPLVPFTIIDRIKYPNK